MHLSINKNRLFLNKHKDFVKQQKGRSMLELLGVLAILGILAIAVMVGFRYAADKSTANLILNDALMANVEIQSRWNLKTTDWIKFEEKVQSGKPIFMMRDIDGDYFVKVLNIPKGPCKRLLDMETENVLKFYTEDGDVFTTCDVLDNIMVFSFDGRGIGKNCEKYEDCGEDFNGYCSLSQGVCIPCSEDEVLSLSKDACLPVCDDEMETPCSSETATWCCPESQVCGEKDGECNEMDGQCIYVFFPGDMIYRTDCSYYYGGDPTLEYYTDCSYDFASGDYTLEYYTDCSYTASAGSNGTFLISAAKSCRNGQYCSIRWSAETWSLNDTTPTLSADATGILYGRCQALTTNTSNALVRHPNGDAALLRPVQGCRDGQYCSMRWSAEKWNSTETTPMLSAEATGRLYGRCQVLTTNTSNALVRHSAGDAALLRPVQGCRSGQYCSMRWSAETWRSNDTEPTLSADATGILYGRCQVLTTNTSSAIIDAADERPYTVEKECPRSHYCLLKWADEQCESTLSADATGRLYGACAERNKNSASCPVGQQK